MEIIQTDIFDFIGKDNSSNLHSNNNQDQRKDKTELSGEQLRDIGMAQAENHANEVNPKWSDIAYRFLLNFLIDRNIEFACEDVRQSSELFVPEPPTARSWGSIMVRAKKAGLIKSIGTRPVKNPKAHCANANVYVKI